MTVARALHKFASPVLYASGTYRRLWCGYHSRRGPFTVVLAYHRVVAGVGRRDRAFNIEQGVPADVFEAQLRFMLRYFAPVLASEALQTEREPMRFAVTLDDGYEDNYRVAAPVLERLGVPGTFFVVSDYVGSDRLFWWEQVAHMMRETRVPVLDAASALPGLFGAGSLPLNDHAQRALAYEALCAAIRGDRHENVPAHIGRLAEALEVRLREGGREYAMMDWEQLRSLAGRGHEIGGHTASHCNVVGLEPQALRHEVIDSMATIEKQTGEVVRSFAYPYGHFDRMHNEVAEVLAESSCRVAFTSDKGVATGAADPYEVPRCVLNRRHQFVWAFNIQDTLNAS